LRFTVLLPATAQQQTSITVTGKLVNIMSIGRESTGWAIQLDDQIAVEGKNVDAIELDGARQGRRPNLSPTWN